MYQIKFVILLIIILFSCKADRDLKIIEDIRSLEYSRISNSDIFEKYAQSSNSNIRLQVVKSIGRMQDSLYVSNIIKLLDDRDERVVEESIFALGQIACKESETILAQLLTNDKFSIHRRKVVEALRKMERKESKIILLNYLNIAPDSLKSLIIEQLAISNYSSKIKNTLRATIEPFLFHNDDILKLKAAYYFSRNPSKLVTEKLIKAKFAVNSLGNKYRLKSLEPAIENIYRQFADSTLLDSIQTSLQESLKDPNLPWQIKLYQIPIYLYEGDSTKINICKNLLLHKNPHIRLQTIFALGRLSSNFAENLLLEFYNQASWSDKGAVIETMAIKNSWLAHRLIQQNLDQGNTNFKAKLLRALAKIPHQSARRQLKQFLRVPNKRLQYTAFSELNKLGLLNSKDIKSVLQVGDVVLTSLAADWISKHPNSNYVQLLIQAYENLSEPKDVEAMITILKTLHKLKNKNSVSFLNKIVQETSETSLFDQASLTLKIMNIDSPERERPIPNLYLPDTIIVNKDEIYATILTERGEIKLKLWAKEAPVTVSNFRYLAKKGFYKNLTFHRVVSDFVIQGGDPRGDGWGGPGYHIPCEYNAKPFLRGSIGMATSSKDTAGSQFFICHSEQPHLNGRYTLFGEVVEGMDVVDMIEVDDKILDISINN